jgi:hypothetical protein
MLDKGQVYFEHPAVGTGQHCGQCIHFIKGKNKCEIVSGVVKAEDWCERFEKRVSKFHQISRET